METKHEAWLKLTIEDPMDPELPICDSHHHLWDYSKTRVPAYITHAPRYLLEELLQDTGGGHHIVQTVFVECKAMYRKGGSQEMRPVGETEFVQGIAAQSASGQYGITAVAAGIVGFADLTLGTEVTRVLEAHIAASRNRFRGIRYLSSQGLLLDSKFREGFSCLQRYNLTFDVHQLHPYLMELVDLARTFPDTPIIVDHTGGPLGTGPYVGKHEEMFQEWKSGIATLAKCPNMVIKLGGLGIPSCGFSWHEWAVPPSSVELAEAMAPYFHWCIEHFGVNRCMFESDFPVDKRSYSYTVLWNAFKRISEDFSPEERDALFHHTATKVYRLATNKL